MKVAIMQPYAFPYIGYFQLIKAVDVFVFYDDVSFIKQGWVNRNKILVNHREYLTTIPISKMSSFSTISETGLHPRNYNVWCQKFSKTLYQNYRKAPHFQTVSSLIRQVLEISPSGISALAIDSVRRIADYLEINTVFKTSSVDFAQSKGMDRAERLIEITKSLGSRHYINPIGGQRIYSKTYFADRGVTLNFIQTRLTPYNQHNPYTFVPGLSIIDVMMFNSTEQIQELLNDYQLV